MPFVFSRKADWPFVLLARSNSCHFGRKSTSGGFYLRSFIAQRTNGGQLLPVGRRHFGLLSRFAPRETFLPSFSRPCQTFFGKFLCISSRSLSSTGMDALGQILDGKAIAKDVQDTILKRSKELTASKGVTPGLAIVQVGDRSDSNVYIRTKLKTSTEVGINAQHVKLPADISEIDVISRIQELNRDPAVHGIIVQLPLDSTKQLNAVKVTDTIDPRKDVDGLHTNNGGHLFHGELSAGPLPCTPKGCMELIRRTGVQVEGKHAVVLGRSKIVGNPMGQLLLFANATVTICHSKTVNLPEIIKQADILVVGIGKANFVRGEWIKPGAVVIDCGINVVPDEKSKTGKRIVGDVDFVSAKERASFITPVPGGVGPMTVAMLLQNTLEAAERSAVGS